MDNVIVVTDCTQFSTLVSKAKEFLAEGKDIYVDLSEVDYMPSSLVGAIIAISNKIKEEGGKLLINNINTITAEQLRIFGFEEFGGFYALKTE